MKSIDLTGALRKGNFHPFSDLAPLTPRLHNVNVAVAMKRLFENAPCLVLATITLFTSAGCYHYNPQPAYGYGATQYLGDFGPPRPPQASPYFRGAPGTPPPPPVRNQDHVSYWDGGGSSGSSRIEIRLGEQKAYFYKGNQLAGVSKISSGDSEHPTPTGTFKVTQKNIDHRSNLYGDFVDSNNDTVVRNVDSRKDKAPPGTRFLGSPMAYFMRFNGGIGMHAGYLPGYPASHGCVRMPKWMAKKFYENASRGTTVTVRH